MLRKATPEDSRNLVQLRCAARHEAAAQATAWVEQIIGTENLLLVMQEPPTIDMALAAVPVTSGQRRGVWFADLLLRPDLADSAPPKRLLGTALRAYKAYGYDFAVTVPPHRNARRWLADLGFRDAFAMRLVHRAIDANLWARADFDTMTVRSLMQARDRYQPGGIQLPERCMMGIVRQLYSRGITLVSNRRGYGLYYVRGNSLQFVELQADNDHAADLLLQAARDKTGCEQADLLLAQAQSIYLGQGRQGRYGMICYLKELFAVNDVYFQTFL